jgi:hypothetical protein
MYCMGSLDQEPCLLRLIKSPKFRAISLAERNRPPNLIKIEAYFVFVLDTIISRSSNLKRPTAALVFSNAEFDTHCHGICWDIRTPYSGHLRRPTREHRIPLYQGRGYEETSASRSCHRDLEFRNRPGRHENQTPIQSPDDDTRGAGRPVHTTSQNHALGATREEILESSSICDSIDAVSDVAQKSSTGDGGLRLRSRGSDIHTVSGFRWLRRNPFRDTAGGYSDGAGSGQLYCGLYKQHQGE